MSPSASVTVYVKLSPAVVEVGVPLSTLVVGLNVIPCAEDRPDTE